MNLTSKFCLAVCVLSLDDENNTPLLYAAKLCDLEVSKYLIEKGANINVIDKEKNEEIKKLRDRSIILIGFSGGFRRNEIVSLDYEDLDFVQEGLKINLRRSKTDQFGEGSVKGLPYFENLQYCPVTSVHKWIEISKIKSGALFRRFIKGSKISDNRLTDQTVALLIKINNTKLSVKNNFALISLKHLSLTNKSLMVPPCFTLSKTC